MDGRVEQLQEKLRQLLKETAEVSAEIQRIDGSQAEVPHYSQIEDAAHATGQELSRMIQQSRVREVALAARPQAACPTCGDVCEVAHPRRSIQSIDGPVETLEPKAHCPRCRRDFFPSTGSTGAR
ncbi:MAG: hypothetical protein KF861_16165 [Planctomycetaceae bacterium]|nr:hypothetical protein [Planctomycetaceae bacterium]